ncbi:hypothetical protein DY000_02055285 [Brassica cretica]|uniref:Uncharacterized protein n=1 Tax=Brassica cretica TaxID=69181 RepID=A0ABQ7AB31_BRACR|nr:hypothetical protein DY000_02055285 [Brassica cretica]
MWCVVPLEDVISQGILMYFVMYFKTCVKTCLTECSVVLGVDVTCGGVVWCIVVIKMCVGVDMLVGMLGVR